VAGGFKSALGGPLGRLSGPSTYTPTTHHVTLPFSWTVRNTHSVVLAFSWNVESATTTYHVVVPFSWNVGLTSTRHRLVRFAWHVLGEATTHSKTLAFSWNVTGTHSVTLPFAWDVTDTDPRHVTSPFSWTVGGLHHVVLPFSWKVARRSHTEIDPGTGDPVEVIDDVDAYADVNGIQVEVPDEWRPPSFDPQGDLIQHSDGSLLLHDVRYRDLAQMEVPVKLSDNDHVSLDAQEEALKAACLAGGTFRWQSVGPGGDVGPMKSYTFAPSPAPVFARNRKREALYRSYASLNLRVWPA
jgi:hypothetical protein